MYPRQKIDLNVGRKRTGKRQTSKTFRLPEKFTGGDCKIHTGKHIPTGARMIYGYIRVSCERQTVENQRFEIRNFCEKRKMEIGGWIEETSSGCKNYDKRRLGKLLKKVHSGDIIVCSELSRLGRNLFMIMEILGICMAKECRVWTIKDGYRLGDDIQSKVLAFAFGLSAEIERSLISQRTREALARKKAEGVKLGRPRGSGTQPEKLKLYKKRELVRDLLRKGTSQSKIAKICHVSRNTVAGFVRKNLYSAENLEGRTIIDFH